MPPTSRLAQLRLRLLRGRRGPVGEDSYRVRRIRGRAYYRSRQEHDALTIVVERFPGPDDVGARSYVLVHGIGVSSRYFRPLAAELTETGRVYLVDLPGYGAAPDPRRDVSLADHAEVIAGFLRETGLANPVIVGHSMGAQVVSMLTRRHPDVADTVVLMAPTMEPRARKPWTAFGRLLQDATREPFSVLWIVMTDYLVRCGVPYLVRQLPHLLDDRLEERVSSHAARTLVLSGDRDPVVSRSWAVSLGTTRPQDEYREVRGPHVVMHSDPVTIAGHIAAFAGAKDLA